MRTIIFWGTGNTLEDCWNKMQERPAVFCDEYPVFGDNNKLLWGEELYGRMILGPDELNKYSYDYIVIASIFGNAIRRQMIEELGVDSDKIINFEEYSRDCFSRWIYRKRYGKRTEGEKHGFNLKNMVIYTALTGDYDTLKPPASGNPDITYVCFTNNKKIKSQVWNIEYVNDVSMDNVRLARKIKMHPHIFLHDFDTSIWVDGKYKIKGDLRRYVDCYGKEMPILCFPHFARECIYDEAAECIACRRGKKEELVGQVNAYYQEGYPFDNGLYETGCIVRNHNDISVKKLMSDWFGEVMAYSYRDQISFPKVCMKNKILPDICDLDINRNKWLRMARFDKE